MVPHLHRQLLEATLFWAKAGHGLILVAQRQPASEDDGMACGYRVARSLLPKGCEIRPLSGDEGFLPALSDILRDAEPDRLFILPTRGAANSLPDTVRRAFPELKPEGICLSMAIGFAAFRLTPPLRGTCRRLAAAAVPGWS